MDDPFEPVTFGTVDMFSNPIYAPEKKEAPPEKVEDSLLKAALNPKANSLHAVCMQMHPETDHYQNFTHWWNYYSLQAGFAKKPRPDELNHYHLAPVLALSSEFRRALIGQAAGDEWWTQLDHAMQALKRSMPLDPRVAKFKALLRP